MSRRLLASLATCLVPALSSAQGLPVDLAFDKPLYVAGETARLRLEGPAGHIPILMISRYPGPSFLPGAGEIALSLTPFPSLVPLGVLPPDGVIEVTCSFDCASPIVDIPCFLQVVTADPQTFRASGLSQLAVLNVATENCGVCPTGTDGDPACGNGSTHAVWLPGIGTDFQFVAGASFVERGDGTAHLSGVIARESDQDASFWLDVDLAGRVSPGEAGFPPAGSPKIELCDDAYFENGGTVEPGAWHYYESLSGRLHGLADYEGALIELERMGPAFQVGFGASGKNERLGASGWLDVAVLAHPDAGDFSNPPTKGDINVDLDEECVECPEEAKDHAFTLPGIAQDMLFEDGAEFVELEDGTALLTGILYDVDDPARRLEASVVLAGLIDPATAAHPPAGSPKLELDAGAYVSGGGLVDPEDWRYYETTEGVLVGLGELEGAELAITRLGPAFQVGLGASGKHPGFGASGWLDVELVSQPTKGALLPTDPPHGDINVRLGECP